jgi:hypothetical protein
MTNTRKFLARIAAAIGAIVLVAAVPSVRAQSPAPRLITQPINPAQLTTLAGNTRPEANAANDRGMVPDSFQLNHMMLQMRRSNVQEQAFETLIDQLHDRNSPNFHQWLTVSEIGTRFGPATADIQAVTGWLAQNGFAVNVVYTDGMVIDFSGTAGQVRTALHTEIHQLSVDGVAHIANMSDPQIPAALAPAVVGIVSLHDFRARPALTVKFPDGTIQYVVTPVDLATIYNFNPVFNNGNTGQNQTIYLIETADVYSTSDWTQFRSNFGLPSPSSNQLQTIHPNPPPLGDPSCVDPATLPAPPQGPGQDPVAQTEATLDTEYASAAAPGATIVLVACANYTTSAATTATDGLLVALRNLINNATTYSPTIISMSYGESETNLGTANQSYYNIYQTAVAMGVSVFVSAGDAGAAESDRSNKNGQPQTAIHGINVNGHASTPYNVAVGGTDFSDTYSGTNSIYWGPDTGAPWGTAKSYIPEIPWNNSCGNQLLASFLGYSTTYGPSGLCNNLPNVNVSNLSLPGGTAMLATARGGSGGPSACAMGTPATAGVVGGSCKGWPRPSWQTGVVGLPDNANGNVRVLPDVALFAANGPWNHSYAFCYSGPVPSGSMEMQKTCGATTETWKYSGGTSFASPIMAGIQALVNQQANAAQGNPNYRYYQLAAKEYGSSMSTACDSSLGNAVAGSCIFYDITMGNNDVPCTYYSTTAPVTIYNCYGLPAMPPTSAYYGVLSTSNTSYEPAFRARTGWDNATGIGSVNVANLVMSWNVQTNTHDFNGDGKSDIAWRDSSGDTAIWLMNGASVLSSAALGNVPTTWSIVGQRDFNGDGYADLLWRDMSGNTAIWFMNVTQILSSAAIGNIPTTWSVVGTGIFPGEGSSSIFWRDTAGDIAVWLVSVSTVQAPPSVTITAGGLGNLPTATWNLAGVGDFDGDGQSDLLWSDTTNGNYSIWFMNGTQVESSAAVGNVSGWSVAGIGDFNGDGKSDIVWTDGNGDYAIWLMNGATVLASAGLGNIPSPWSIVQTGDYDGNGTSDLLWNDGSGDISIWFMNGVNVSSTAAVGTVPNNWTVQSLNAE